MGVLTGRADVDGFDGGFRVLSDKFGGFVVGVGLGKNQQAFWTRGRV
jgi:hypothetical protein